MQPEIFTSLQSIISTTPEIGLLIFLNVEFLMVKLYMLSPIIEGPELSTNLQLSTTWFEPSRYSEYLLARVKFEFITAKLKPKAFNAQYVLLTVILFIDPLFPSHSMALIASHKLIFINATLSADILNMLDSPVPFTSNPFPLMVIPLSIGMPLT